MAREGLFLEKWPRKPNAVSKSPFIKVAKQAALAYILHGNPVHLQVPPDSPYRAQIEANANAALPPIPIVSLSTELEKKGPPRGNTFPYKAARYIDQLASNFDDMWWWIDEKVW
jgi:hypothetical protein